MKYGLGIDTGGTYTDAVIYDLERDRIIDSAKSPTTKENLTLGINDALDQLPSDILKRVKLVALSTTLATNASVEGKGSRATLVLIGCDREIVSKYGREYGLPDASDIIFLDGGHTQEGEVKKEPCWDLLKQKVLEHIYKTDAFAIVELWGTRNHDFEDKAKELITEWTGLPVVCGHELTAVTNSLKRAATALLNAQLIPLINDFLNAVKASLQDKGIEAPLFVVRGDGSLMAEDFARQKPVETLLSGPSASVCGGMHLAREKNSVIIDMGGTTSDIAIIKNGRVSLAEDGASIGRWKTGTKSILINTVGLGGDSLIRHTEEGDITLGPVRVAPLSWLVSCWPELLEDIKSIYYSRKKHTVSLCEFFYLLRDIPEGDYYNDEEKKIVSALKKRPMSIIELSKSVDSSVYQIQVQRLERQGIIMRSGLTPTDIMHIKGDFTKWNEKAAYYGAMIMAFQLDISLDELVNMVYEKVKERLYYNIVMALLENGHKKLLKGGASKQLDELIIMSYRMAGSQLLNSDLISFSFSTNYTVVGIGAPIHIFLPDVARALNTRYVIPENASVANAVGAITGNVMVEETVAIVPQYDISGIRGYLCFSSEDRAEFTVYEEALGWAKAEAHRLAKEMAIARGAEDPDIELEIEEEKFVGANQDDDVEISDYATLNEDERQADVNEKGKKDKLLLEARVTAKAVGKLKWV